MEKKMRKDEVLEILREMKKGYYSVFNKIAHAAAEMKEKWADVRIDLDFLRERILEDHVELQEEMKSIVNEIYMKHNTNEEEFQYNCNTVFAHDREIAILQTSIRENFEKSCMGITPDLRTELPDFMTPEFTLRLYEKLSRNCAIKLRDTILDIKKEGHDVLLPNNSIVEERFQKVDLAKLRLNILEESKLGGYDEPAEKIFQYAVEKYKNENPENFVNKISKIELSYQQVVDLAFKNPELLDSFLEDIQVQPTQTPYQSMVLARSRDEFHMNAM
eukprot:TRINITY_DN12383_c0_g1_i1.p1 TRINITY_DN12383_c0_g1~~TRINITY_DN12383_c0_g1_i1.p1  ORF type:complete len:275 (+),score=74.81 TRINITY_DN12383_c0_g1_i1:17-841(+)